MKAIERAVKTITNWETFTSKLVALGSDGAAVMLGKNFVISYLRSDNCGRNK